MYAVRYNFSRRNKLRIAAILAGGLFIMACSCGDEQFDGPTDMPQPPPSPTARPTAVDNTQRAQPPQPTYVVKASGLVQDENGNLWIDGTPVH